MTDSCLPSSAEGPAETGGSHGRISRSRGGLVPWEQTGEGAVLRSARGSSAQVARAVPANTPLAGRIPGGQSSPIHSFLMESSPDQRGLPGRTRC